MEVIVSYIIGNWLLAVLGTFVFCILIVAVGLWKLLKKVLVVSWIVVKWICVHLWMLAKWSYRKYQEYKERKNSFVIYAD